MRLPAEFVTSLRPSFEGRSVCVTGGAGFIGGHLVDALLSLGASICVIDDLSNSGVDHLAELIDLDPARVRFVHGSILDPKALSDAVSGSSMVFHLAAMGSVPKSIEEPRRAFAVNALGTVAVLEAARSASVSRMVFASSSSIYGGEGSPPASGANQAPAARVETMPSNPLSPYAASKLAGEAAVRAWSRSYALPAVSLRFFNVFGPRQSSESQYAAVVPVFARRLLAGEPSTIFGDGRQTRDFTFVANAVAALLLGATAKGLEGQAVNVGTGHAVSLLELHGLMAKRCAPAAQGRAPEPVLAPARPGDVRHSLADVSLASRLLGYRVLVPLDAGLDETVAWYRRLFAEAP
ncbi:MAG: NAD-dependent epimerase/dehydratase family protein [Phycisphaerales bacterium]